MAIRIGNANLRISSSGASNTPLFLKKVYFETSGDWERPEEMVGDTVYITMIGAGGNGGSHQTVTTGGNGGYIKRNVSVDISDVNVGETIPVTIGQPYTGPAVFTGTPPTGGASSFGGYLTASGGGCSPLSTSGAQNTTQIGGSTGGRQGMYGSNGNGSGECGSGGTSSYNATGGGGGLIGIGNVSPPPTWAGGVTIGNAGVGYGAGGSGYQFIDEEDIQLGAPGVAVVQYYVEAV